MRYWFRVQSHGTEHVPRQGPALLVGNHSGTLPFDAMMVWTDVILRCRRLPRAVADYFVPALPYVSTLYARSGVVGGSEGNVRALLHLHYGEPLHLHEGLRPEDADDPEVVRRAAERVQHAVQALVNKGLRLRKGVFR